MAVHLLDDWFDPIEAGFARWGARVHPNDDQGRARGGAFPPALRRSFKDGSLGCRWTQWYRRPRHGRRSRSLLWDLRPGADRSASAPGLVSAEGRTTEWKSAALRTYQRRTKQADCRRLSCRTNTRRVRRSLSAVPSGYGQLSPAEGKG